MSGFFVVQCTSGSSPPDFLTIGFYDLLIKQFRATIRFGRPHSSMDLSLITAVCVNMNSPCIFVFYDSPDRAPTMPATIGIRFRNMGHLVEVNSTRGQLQALLSPN